MAETFTFRGNEYRYFRHVYNSAGQNMRAVEVPIVWEFVRGREWENILEIGNVLSHYRSVGWPVLDAREKRPGVINADIMAWQPEQPFDRIISISTLEHVGYGRYAHITEPGTTPADALQRIRGWLVPCGKALLTVPIGYNQMLDEQLMSGTLPFDDVYFMRRISDRNEWVECSHSEAIATERPDGYRWAVAMAALYCYEEGKPMDVLNLGAGKKRIDGAVNHDRELDDRRPWLDVVHDLNVLPWPWEDESFDRIVARSVFEHLDVDLVASMNECWRLLRPGGTLYLKLPHWNSDIAYRDVTHRWRFSVRSFDQFDPGKRRGQEYDFYTDRTWKIVKPARLNDAKSSIHVTMEVRK